MTEDLALKTDYELQTECNFINSFSDEVFHIGRISPGSYELVAFGFALALVNTVGQMYERAEDMQKAIDVAVKLGMTAFKKKYQN